MRISIDSGVVDVWVIDLQLREQTLERAYDVLSDDELQRAERFHFPIHSRRFVASRAALRTILASYLHTSPKELVFEHSDYGKPRLATPASDIQFNASRSHEKALVACTRNHEIGVDIEWAGRNVEVDELATRFFAPGENAKLRRFPAGHRNLAFFRCWTFKEAFVKGVGKGLSIGLDTFDVAEGLGEPNLPASTSCRSCVVNGWTITELEGAAMDGYVGAIAAEGNRLRANIRTWTE